MISKSVLVAIAIGTATVLPVHAWSVRGSAEIAQGKSVLNADFGSDLYLNIAKGFGSMSTVSPGGLPALLNADQYPVGTLPSKFGGNVPIATGYYGHYTVQWTGTAAFNIASSLPTIVYSGGAGVYNVTPSNTGSYFGSPTFYNNTSQISNMNVEFSFGTLLTAAGTNGGNVQLTTVTNGAFQFTAGTHVKFFTGVSSNLTTGPNSDGSWTILSHDSNTQITLANSSSIAGSVTITGSGGVGTQSEMIMDVSNIGTRISINFPSTIPGQPNPIYAFSNFVWCKTSDLADINAGYQVSSAAINFIKTLKPKYVRFMDLMATQTLYSNYSQRAPVGSLYYSPTRWDPTTTGSSWAGVGDNFTVSNPSGSGSGAYVDGEVVQATAATSQSTEFPTLNVGGRGAAPIYSNTATQQLVPLEMPLSGSPTTGDVISVVFGASYFTGSSHTFTYTVQSSDTSLSAIAAHMVTNLQADDTLAAAGFLFGNSGGLSAYYVPSNGALTVTSSTSGAATEILTPTRLPPGTIISGNDYTFIYNSALQGWIVVNNGGALGAGIPLEIIYEICNRAHVGAWLSLPITYTQSSYQSLGGAVATNMPGLPVITEVGNEIWNTFEAPANEAISLGVALGFTGATSSYSFRAMYSFYGLRVAQMLPAFASGYTGAGGSRSNLQLVLENWALDGETSAPSNNSMQPYRWNGGLLSPTPATATVSFSGTTATISGISGYIYPSWTLTGSCVAVGTKIVRPLSASDGNGTYTVNISNSGTCSVTVGNPTYAAIGGPGGTSTSSSYNAFPNRPIDLVDGIGYAVYYYGALVGQGSCTFAGGNCSGQGSPSWTGKPSSYWNNIFGASENYAQGVATSNQSLITSALNSWSADVRNGTLNGVAGSATIASFLATPGGPIQGFETFAAGYDGTRSNGAANLSVYQYEGALQQTLAFNNINGTTTAQSPTDLNNQFTANGWTSLDATYGYPGFGSGSSQTATNIVSLFLAYLNSPQYYADQLYLWQQSKAIYADRPNFSPAQFGVEGTSGITTATGAPLWGLLPGDLTSAPLQNYNAEQYYNLNFLLKMDVDPASNDNDPMWLNKAA